jgi:hypothetical protein
MTPFIFNFVEYFFVKHALQFHNQFDTFFVHFTLNEKSNGKSGKVIHKVLASDCIFAFSSNVTTKFGFHSWLSIAILPIFNLFHHIVITISAVFVFLISASNESVRSLTQSIKVIGILFQ